MAVHSPEFEFEKNYDNVVEAAGKHGLEYPIVQDNEFKTWRSFSNRYWPAKYLIDSNGILRYLHIGEGRTRKPSWPYGPFSKKPAATSPTSTLSSRPDRAAGK